MWAIVRAQVQVGPWPILLVALMLIPMLLALLISWTVSPIYLDRSFSLITPAYVLLLSWGLTHPPRSSPLPLLFGGLLVVVAVSLSNYYFKPDPAKPPFREVSVVLRSDWREKDVLLNLHDSSYVPLRYYIPELDSYVLNNDPDSWIPAYTWSGWLGGLSLWMRLWLASRAFGFWLCLADLMISRQSFWPRSELVSEAKTMGLVCHGHCRATALQSGGPKSETTGDCASCVERTYETIIDVK